jgi:hypothetical protein
MLLKYSFSISILNWSSLSRIKFDISTAAAGNISNIAGFRLRPLATNGLGFGNY